MYKIKHRSEDFRVSEVLVLEQQRDKPKFWYYLLRKKNISTFDAVTQIKKLSRALIDEQIGWAGLKDEEGITEQYLSCSSSLDGLVGYHVIDADVWIELERHGAGNEPIEVGQNFGNAFCITVRNLSKNEIARLRDLAGKTVFFVNYYDEQRFGLPGKPKITHEIGRAYWEGQYDEAFALAKRASIVKHETVSIDDVLLAQRAFWLCSYESAIWNRVVADKFSTLFPSGTIWPSPSGQLWLVDSKLLSNVPPTDYRVAIRKHRIVDGRIEIMESYRNTIEHFTPRLVRISECNFFDGKLCATLAFALSTGTYATMAIRSLMSESTQANSL